MRAYNWNIEILLGQPHMPYDAPQEFFDLYPLEDMDLPYNPYTPEDMPASAWTPFTRQSTFNHILICFKR